MRILAPTEGAAKEKRALVNHSIQHFHAGRDTEHAVRCCDVLFVQFFYQYRSFQFPLQKQNLQKACS